MAQRCRRGSNDASAQKLRRYIRGNLLVVQSGQYRAREQVRSRRIGNYVEDSHPMGAA
jgi:hypothetical protein